MTRATLVTSLALLVGVAQLLLPACGGKIDSETSRPCTRLCRAVADASCGAATSDFEGCVARCDEVDQCPALAAYDRCVGGEPKLACLLDDLLATECRFEFEQVGRCPQNPRGGTDPETPAGGDAGER
jgi:hypothetical protein